MVIVWHYRLSVGQVLMKRQHSAALLALALVLGAFLIAFALVILPAAPPPAAVPTLMVLPVLPAAEAVAVQPTDAPANEPLPTTVAAAVQPAFTEPVVATAQPATAAPTKTRVVEPSWTPLVLPPALPLVYVACAWQAWRRGLR